jgi:hypothetical protein
MPPHDVYVGVVDVSVGTYMLKTVNWFPTRQCRHPAVEAPGHVVLKAHQGGHKSANGDPGPGLP